MGFPICPVGDAEKFEWRTYADLPDHIYRDAKLYRLVEVGKDLEFRPVFAKRNVGIYHRIHDQEMELDAMSEILQATTDELTRGYTYCGDTLIIFYPAELADD